MTEKHQIIPVWFFVGLLLLTSGALIFISGLAEWSHPPPTVLSNLHAPVWWGVVLLAVGAFYTFRFFPRKPK